MSETGQKRDIVEALGAHGLIGALQAVLDRVAGDNVTLPLAQPKMHPEGAPEVIKSIIQVMIKVHEIPKLGRNKVDNYDYVRFVDLAAKLQDALALYHLVMAQRTVKKAVIGKVIFLDFQFDLYHSSGQYILNMMSLPGACRFEFKSGTTDDKSPGKAITAGLKSAVISLFKIPAGVDGDIERESFVDAEGQLLNPPDRPRGRDDDRARDEPRDAPRDPPRDPPREERTRGGYDPETGEVPMDRPRDNRAPREEWGGPPPGFDDAPPFGGPPDPPSAPPPPVHSGPPPQTPPEDDQREFRRKVQALSDSLNNARAPAEGDRIWVENADLIRGVSDSTYEYLRNAFEQRWNQPPPAI
jgi:hypothetical protein